MSHPQTLFFEPQPPHPPGISLARLIMLFQAAPGIWVSFVLMVWFLESLPGGWSQFPWFLGYALPIAALAGTAFSLAVRLRPGLYRPWKAALILQAGVGTLFPVLAAVSILVAKHAHSYLSFFVFASFPFVAVLGTVLCWTAFALLLMPSSRPSASAPPKETG